MGYTYEVPVGRMSNLVPMVPMVFSCHDSNGMLQMRVIGKMESGTFGDMGLGTRGVREREEVSSNRRISVSVTYFGYCFVKFTARTPDLFSLSLLVLVSHSYSSRPRDR